MQGIRTAYYKFCEFWTPRRVARLFIVLFVISMVPLLYCSFYDYATGDDLGYSAAVHRLILEGASLGAILQSIWGQVVKSWYSFQGTWSSIILFQLQPGIWGERVYAITPWIALLCLMGGTGYLLYDLLVRRLRFNKNLYVTILAILSMLSIQYMPKIRGGMFWYTSVSHYVIPYCAALMCITWAMRWLDTGWKRYYIPMLLLMTYLGGAGYPPIVLAAVIFVLMILGTFCGVLGSETGAARNRRAWLLIIPLLFELAGFVVSAIAPGNKVRGGDDFGFGAGRAVAAIIAALQRGITDCIGYFISGRLILVGFVIIAVSAYEAYDVVEHRVNARYPLAVIILAYLVSSSVRAPELYAGVEVSGGVPDVDFFVTILCMTVTICYMMVWCKNRMADRQQALALDTDYWNRKIRTPILLLAFVFCMVFARHLVGGTADYMCMNYIASGGLSDFAEQMEERLAILEDDSIQDAVLPAMNEYQGPIMHMPLSEDPTSFTNDSTAKYYGKDSVVCVPREEYSPDMNIRN